MNRPHSTILYVAHEARDSLAFRAAFEESFRIATVTTAADALRLLSEEAVAVLVSEQRLQGTTGVTLCAESKRRWPDVISMVVTPYADLGPVVEAVSRGEVARYFIKPWRHDLLADALAAGIQAFQLASVARDVRARLLQPEQQATATFVLGRVLHEIVSPAVGIRDNLESVVDTVARLALAARDGEGEVAALAADLLPALQDAYGAAQDLVGRIDRFRQGDTPATDRSAGASLEQAVQTAAGIVRGRARDRALLIVDTTEKPRVLADATQLSQIVVNLLVNACEAIEPGHPEQNQITVSTFIKENRCGIVVEDSGKGISPEVRDRSSNRSSAPRPRRPTAASGWRSSATSFSTWGGA